MAERSLAAQKRAYAILRQQELTGTVSAPVPSWESKKAAQSQKNATSKAEAARRTRAHKARQNATFHKVTKKGK